MSTITFRGTDRFRPDTVITIDTDSPYLRNIITGNVYSSDFYLSIDTTYTGRLSITEYSIDNQVTWLSVSSLSNSPTSGFYNSIPRFREITSNWRTVGRDLSGSSEGVTFTWINPINDFVTASINLSSTVEPTNPRRGHLWYNPNTSQLYIYED